MTVFVVIDIKDMQGKPWQRITGLINIHFKYKNNADSYIKKKKAVEQWFS